MLILALPLISIIFKNKLGSFGTDCRYLQDEKKSQSKQNEKLIFNHIRTINI